MNIPECYNAKEKSCPRSDTFVEREKEIDGKIYFVVRCRTCQAVNIWPADTTDAAGRYEAFLRKKAQASEAERERERRKVYSFT